MKSKLDFKKFLKSLGVELAILVVTNPIINKIVFSTKMEAGSWGLFAPLIFFEKVFSNSQLIRSRFVLFNLIIDILIILAIALIFSYKRRLD